MEGLCPYVLSVVEFSLPVAVGLSFLSTSPFSGFDGPRISRQDLIWPSRDRVAIPLISFVS